MLCKGQHHHHHQRQVLITIVIIVVAITKVRAESMLTYVLDESKLQLLEVIFTLFINKKRLENPTQNNNRYSQDVLVTGVQR